MDVLLLAEGSPRGMSWAVVLHHQGEAGPGEVCSYVLTTRHYAHNPTHTADKEAVTGEVRSMRKNYRNPLKTGIKFSHSAR